jgi:hypothetical protein
MAMAGVFLASTGAQATSVSSPPTGNYCENVTLYAHLNFAPGAFDRFDGSCIDLRVCALIDDWNDRADSLGVS